MRQRMARACMGVLTSPAMGLARARKARCKALVRVRAKCLLRGVRAEGKGVMWHCRVGG